MAIIPFTCLNVEPQNITEKCAYNYNQENVPCLAEKKLYTKQFLMISHSLLDHPLNPFFYTFCLFLGSCLKIYSRLLLAVDGATKCGKKEIIHGSNSCV